eukprot:2930210-Alexandrium_andersonii.AAC.1
MGEHTAEQCHCQMVADVQKCERACMQPEGKLGEHTYTHMHMRTQGDHAIGPSRSQTVSGPTSKITPTMVKPALNDATLPPWSYHGAAWFTLLMNLTCMRSAPGRMV